MDCKIIESSGMSCSLGVINIVWKTGSKMQNAVGAISLYRRAKLESDDVFISKEKHGSINYMAKDRDGQLSSCRQWYDLSQMKQMDFNISSTLWILKRKYILSSMRREKSLPLEVLQINRKVGLSFNHIPRNSTSGFTGYFFYNIYNVIVSETPHVDAF